MNLYKLIFTNNACYKADKKIKPRGIMVHSTGCNNPNLKRYVGPDDGLLGENLFGNHWNQKMSSNVCVHAFIGKLKDGTIATYQTLPWDHRGWHGGGASNDTHIGFEICEDGLRDASYFTKVYREAVELCAYLCKLFDLTESSIICHSEGHARGIASNHGDVMHWFPIHGKSMDTFRADVKALLTDAEPEYTLGMRILREGCTGEDVRALQILLKAKGYDLGTAGPNKDGVDGKYGPKTKAAVRSYQHAENLKEDGVAGHDTMSHLLGVK